MGDKSVVDVLGRNSIIHGLKDVIFMLSENREGKVFALDGNGDMESLIFLIY